MPFRSSGQHHRLCRHQRLRPAGCKLFNRRQPENTLRRQTKMVTLSYVGWVPDAPRWTPGLSGPRRVARRRHRCRRMSPGKPCSTCPAARRRACCLQRIRGHGSGPHCLCAVRTDVETGRTRHDAEHSVRGSQSPESTTTMKHCCAVLARRGVERYTTANGKRMYCPPAPVMRVCSALGLSLQVQESLLFGHCATGSTSNRRVQRATRGMYAVCQLPGSSPGAVAPTPVAMCRPGSSRRRRADPPPAQAPRASAPARRRLRRPQPCGTCPAEAE
jgi:hypothetical protein